MAMTAKKTSRKYNGKYTPLSKPIVIPTPALEPISLIASESGKKQYAITKSAYAKENANLAMAESFKKFELLFDFYNLDIKKDGWPILALRLAQEFIPGFTIQRKKKPGAPTVWNEEKQLELYWEVNDLLEKKQKSNPSYKVSDACALLSKQRNVSAKTLQNQYSKVKNSSLLKFIQSFLGNINSSNRQEIKKIFLSFNDD